jgi:hypothetical protein
MQIERKKKEKKKGIEVQKFGISVAGKGSFMEKKGG